MTIDLILAACDMEGNFLVVKVGDSCDYVLRSLKSCSQAYQYTDLLSCMLLNSWLSYIRMHYSAKFWLKCRWSISVCLFFSWIYMRPKYHWTQILVSDAVSWSCFTVPGLIRPYYRVYLCPWGDSGCLFGPTYSRIRISQPRPEGRAMHLWL